jgi:DMSO reductase anchor subunit
MIRKLHTHVFGSANLDKAAESRHAKLLAGTLLASWLIATTAGRVMAYTVPTKLQTAVAVLVVAALALLVGYCVGRILGWTKSPANEGVSTPVSLQK